MAIFYQLKLVLFIAQKVENKLPTDPFSTAFTFCLYHNQNWLEYFEKGEKNFLTPDGQLSVFCQIKIHSLTVQNSLLSFIHKSYFEGKRNDHFSYRIWQQFGFDKRRKVLPQICILFSQKNVWKKYFQWSIEIWHAFWHCYFCSRRSRVSRP